MTSQAISTEPAEFDLLKPLRSAGSQDNPYPVYSLLRTVRPVLEMPIPDYDGPGAWLLTRYRDVTMDELMAPLNAKSGLPAIRAFFEFAANHSRRTAYRGCFFGNASMENGPTDNRVAAISRQGFMRLRARFVEVLRDAQQGDQIRQDRDLEAMASLLLSIFYGIQVLAKAKAKRSVLEEVVKSALDVIQ